MKQVNQYPSVPSDTILKPKIESLFNLGRTNNEILVELANTGCKIGRFTLKRRLKEWNLTRKELDDREAIQEAIQRNIAGVHATAGIRRMKQILLAEDGLFVKQETVRNIMFDIDPDGIVARKKRVLKRRYVIILNWIAFSGGPNHIWSFDGHDKLKKYGLAIHGCVDTFSGKILWLNVWTGNNDPDLIEVYYLKAILDLGVFPYNTRSDYGTETIGIYKDQHALHEVFFSMVTSQ